MLQRTAQEGLSVREIEKLSGESKKSSRSDLRIKKKNIEVASAEEDLKEIFGTKVNLIERGKRGKIEIEYYSRDELERLLELLKTLK